MDEQLCEEVIKAHGERVAGVLKIVKATPTEELTRRLVKELTELLEDSFASMVVALSQLEAEASKRPRQVRMDFDGMSDGERVGAREAVLR